MSVTAQAIVDIVKERPTKAHGPRKERSHLKIFWDCCRNKRSETEFKEDIRLDRGTFEVILNRTSANIYKTTINMEPNSYLTKLFNTEELSHHHSSFTFYQIFFYRLFSSP